MFACLLLSTGYIKREFSYDRHHANSVVDKTLFEHKIANPVLKEQIERFDSFYGNDPAVKRNKINGISITYSKNSGYYPDDWVFNFFLIGYTDEINSMQPLIMCEPINGKPVVFKINDLLDYIEIPRRKSMEFLKESSPKEYDSLIELGALRDINTGSFQFSFVQWMVIFDHNNNNFLRVDTIRPLKF